MIARILTGLALCSSLQAYSVLTHEAIVDSLWDASIQKLLLKRFPNATPDDLDKAHAFTYGGCIIQDMGYYPFGSHLFSDLTHYVRSGDFIQALLRESQNLEEYAFALGALAHYAADNNGHRIAINPGVPLLYPKLEREFGPTVTYWDDHASHMRTEFGLDVLQVAGGHYAPNQYHKFIGFEVSKPVLERAFLHTYGIELKDVFKSLDLALGTYRYAVSSVIPSMVRVAWDIKKDQLIKATPGLTRKKFLYNISRSSYEKEWGKQYHRPGVGTRIVAWFIRILPKVGPLKSLQFRPPTPEVERMFMASFNATVDTYKTLLIAVDTGRLELPNRNFDVGDLTRLGAYQGADEAYETLVGKLAEHKFNGLPGALRANVLAFYADAKEPIRAKTPKQAEKEKTAWTKLMDEVAQMQAAASAESDATQ